MEYKFRGKRIDNREWVYGDLIRINGKTQIFDPNYSRNKTKIVIPETVGQYSGFEDEMNTELYDGDICSDADECGQVCFEDGAFYYKGYDTIELLEEWHDSIHRIGNIYDNKELLK